MSDLLRTLNEDGINSFASYLQSLRDGGTSAPPFHLLTDPSTSEAIAQPVPLQAQWFADAYGFGRYLSTALASLDRRKISYDHGLWSWLALYFFDQICPARNGVRKVLEDSVYILTATFDHRRYYRHLVKMPWLAVQEHGENAKVLLQTKAGGKRSDLFEQLAAYQNVFGNRTIVAAAYKLFYDPAAQSPKRGSGGKGAGSPRRLVAFIRQIERTYDLCACTPEQFVGLLPKEFDKWLESAAPVPSKKRGIARIIAQIISASPARPSPEA